MTHNDFYNLVYANWRLYLLSLAICVLFFTYLGKRFTHTWFDPLRFQLVASAFATAVFVFLYFKGIIRTNIFLYFVLAELFFWIAFIVPSKKNVRFSPKKLVNEKSISFVLYLVFLILFILFTVITYILLGIPIFMGSRLDTYVGSGLGVLGRMMPFFKLYCIFYSFYLFENSKKLSLERFLVLLVFLIFVVTGILSGSRSSFFIFMFVYWGYCYYYHNDLVRITKHYKLFILGIFITIITFAIQSGSNNLFGSFRPFFERIIASGDAYFMALPKDTWMKVEIGDWYKHLFYGLIGPTRLMSGENVMLPVGFQLTGLVYPVNAGVSTGPLSIPALLGFLYFGWGGLIFSLILGFLISLVIFNLPSMLPNGIISSVLILYVVLQFLTFIIDPCLGMGYLFDTVLNITFLIFLITVLQYLFSKQTNRL
jgi:oligosaccharide repeat unit polymerase